MNPVVSQLSEYPLFRLDDIKARLRAEGKPVYDFGVGDPREPTPVFIREAMLRAVPEVSQYPPVAGTAALRSAIAGYLKRRFSVEAAPDDLLACAGAKEAIFHLPLTLLDPDGDRRVVVYPDPGYPVYERGTRFAGGEPHPARLGPAANWLLEPRDVPEHVLSRTAIFWINYPHNPTGAACDDAYLRRVAEAAEAFGFWVASDECYADIYYDRAPPSILQHMKRRALAVHSLSKRSGMTGYRSGFVAGDPEGVRAIRRARGSFGVGSPEFIQAAATAAWNDDAHAEARRRVFAEKRSVMTDAIAAAGLRVEASAATIYLWVAVPDGESAESFASRLLRVGIVVSPGPAFGAGEGYVRVALSPTLDDCRAAAPLWRLA
jgi:acetylornithine aminotransferase